MAVSAALLALAGFAPPAPGEVVQADGVRIAYAASLFPTVLPRHGTAPARVSFGARLWTPDGSLPPRLRRIAVAINRHGFFDRRGLPRCRLRQIQPATAADALRACRRSLIGEGWFEAQVLIPDQAPFPSSGRVRAFYGSYRGRPAILAHVFGRQPVPTSYTIPFRIGRERGRFATTLTAALEPSLGEAGYITLLRLTLGGRFGHLRASCPAPARQSTALFPLAALSIGLGARQLRTTLMRGCRVAASERQPRPG